MTVALARANISGLAVGIVTLWLILSAQPQPAQSKPTDANPWAVNCSSGSANTELQCQLSQNLTEAKTGQRV
ncbi:MAG: invasion associated locus B family protein, partial [Mesorhizobium sp.]